MKITYYYASKLGNHLKSVYSSKRTKQTQKPIEMDDKNIWYVFIQMDFLFLIGTPVLMVSPMFIVDARPLILFHYHASAHDHMNSNQIDTN